MRCQAADRFARRTCIRRRELLESPQLDTEDSLVKQTTHRIGIIGGSGLYHMEGFTRQKWVKVATPFGTPSDDFLTGELSGRARRVSAAPRARASASAQRAQSSREHLRHEETGRGLDHQRQRRGLACRPSTSPATSSCRTSSSTAPSSPPPIPSSGAGIVAHIAFADPICEELRQVLLRSARAARRARPRRRHLREYGRTGVQHARRESLTNQPLATM